MKYIFPLLFLLTITVSNNGYASSAYISNSKLTMNTTSCMSSQQLCSRAVQAIVDVITLPTGNDNRTMTCPETAGAGGCWFGPVIYGYSGGAMRQGMVYSPGQAVWISNNTTVASGISAWIATYGTSVAGASTPVTAYSQNIWWGSPVIDSYEVCFAPYITSGSQVRNFVVGSCQIPPTPPAACTSLPDMNFDHNTITAGINLQNKQIVNAVLNCTAVTSATFSLSSPIMLDSGIVNHFYINDQLLDTSHVTINMTGNSTPIQFSSVIESAAHGGSFSASSVLIMSVN